jgi:NAD-dependent dihydropyrimidine dehydrogenase PreA subunit
MTISIDYKKCCWKDGKCSSCTCGNKAGKCEGCVEACPVEALERKKLVVYYKDKCINCGACIDACSHKAIKMID